MSPRRNMVIKHLRWYMVGLLFPATLLNYLDRQALSVAAPTICKDLHLSELDWVGTLPGKRETRRFEGDHILSQSDIEQQRPFEDAVACGGWGFDHHPKDGFFDRHSPSFHVYHPGPYNIPLRSLYSRKVTNLFLAGRNISATHYGLSSTRVMLTCAQLGEAVGTAAAVALRHNLLPRQLLPSSKVAQVQTALLKGDHHLYNVPYRDEKDLGQSATVTASSVLRGASMESSAGVVPPNGGVFPSHIESLNDIRRAGWLERVLHLLPVEPRPEGYNPLGEKCLNAEWIARLGQTGKDCFEAIRQMDAKAPGTSMNACMVCWEHLLPHTVLHPAVDVDLKAILEAYQDHYLGAMYSGCGGGYLFVVSEEPVPGAFKVDVRVATP